MPLSPCGKCHRVAAFGLVAAFGCHICHIYIVAAFGLAEVLCASPWRKTEHSWLICHSATTSLPQLAASGKNGEKKNSGSVLPVKPSTRGTFATVPLATNSGSVWPSRICICSRICGSIWPSRRLVCFAISAQVCLLPV